METDDRNELERQLGELDAEIRELRLWQAFWADRASDKHVSEPVGAVDKGLIGNIAAHLQAAESVREWIAQRLETF